MKRYTIHPEVRNASYDPSQGPISFSVVAKSLIQEDDDGAWVHHDDAAKAIKQAAENAGDVTLRQRYKIAALSIIAEPYLMSKDYAKACGKIADAMLAEDEEHAKK